MTKTARGKYDRSQTTEERHAATREKLLDDATEVFAARGYRDTRVDDLVEFSNISRRTLYQHFESVPAILDEVYERAVRISFQTVFERLVNVTDPIERVHAGVRAYYEMIAENPSAARVVFDEYRYAGPAQMAKYELNTARYAMLMYEFLNVAYAVKRLGRAPDEVTVYALTKGLEGVGVRALNRKEVATLPALAPLMSQLILHAFDAT